MKFSWSFLVNVKLIDMCNEHVRVQCILYNILSFNKV